MAATMFLAASAVCISMIATPVAGAQPSCGPDQDGAVRLAFAQLPFEPLTGARWDGTPVDSNYDPCAELSTILVTTEGGTRMPGECNACAPAAVHSARYRWNGDRAVMLDPPPPTA